MIRKAQKKDLPRLLEIYAAAREFMRNNGNPTQWSDRYPLKEDLAEDIRLGRLYALEDSGRLCACFMLSPGPDPTYAQISGGAWGYGTPYGVLHRVASDGTVHGVVARCVAFAGERFPHLRIDTHENNLPMQRALARLGFTYRGIIIAGDGTPRLAFDRLSV